MSTSKKQILETEEMLRRLEREDAERLRRISMTPVPFVDTCIEHAYGTTTRLSFQIRVF